MDKRLQQLKSRCSFFYRQCREVRTMPVWIWFVAAGVLGVAELLTGTFYMLILAVAPHRLAAGTSGGVIRPGGLLRSLVTTPSISGSRSR